MINYTYDGLQRLVEADSIVPEAQRSGNSTGEKFEYGYDAVGNRSVYTALVTSTVATTYNYDAANRLITVTMGGAPRALTWDDLGQLTADGDDTYEFNAAGRLVSATVDGALNRYAYLGDGSRISMTVGSDTTTYTLDVAVGLVQVLAAHEDGGDTLYLYGLSRVGEDDGSGWVYYLADHLGSVRSLADGDGEIVGMNAYRPYGETLDTAGAASMMYGYAGEAMDVTGLTYLRARYYAPGWGGFVSRDPWRGNVLRPRTLDQYIYVLNNPINGTDPSGKVCIFGVGNCDEEEDFGRKFLKSYLANAAHAIGGATDVAQEIAVMPWEIMPTVCIDGLGCSNSPTYADDLREYYDDMHEYNKWTLEHPAQAWGLDEDDLKTWMIEGWFLEGGEDRIELVDNHSIIQILKQHKGVNEARNKFYYTERCDKTIHHYSVRQGKQPTNPMLWPTIIIAHGQVLLESLAQTPDSTKTVDGTLGSYKVTVVNNGDGTATFNVYNRSSWKSLTYDLGPAISRDENPIPLGGNMHQDYIWKEPIPPGICDCP